MESVGRTQRRFDYEAVDADSEDLLAAHLCGQRSCSEIERKDARMAKLEINRMSSTSSPTRSCSISDLEQALLAL